IAPLAMIATAIGGPPAGATAGWLAFAGVAGLMLAGLLPMRQTRRRPVDLEFHPGYIRVKGAATRNQTILSKSIVGASTARTKDGVLLTLTHTGRNQPIAME